VAVIGWAGPWPVQERWWAPAEANLLVRLQLGLADGRALLVVQRCPVEEPAGPEGGDGWQLEAVYD
jgi:protein ImuB